MEETNLELTPEEQAIADKATGNEVVEDSGDVELPSNQETEPEEGDVKLAGKYNSVEELRSGIDNIGSDLPEYVLEGMSDSALEQHYLELQKDFSSNDKGRKHAEKSEEPNEEETKGKPEAVTEELWSELESYYSENGTITDDMYDELNKAGIPDNVIDKYMDGLAADQQQFTDKVFDIAGGQEQFMTIKAWAEDGNIPQSTLDAIGKMDYDGMLIAMQGIKAQYDSANQGEPVATRLTGSTSGGGKGSYANQTEYMMDVADKRYGVDKKYTYAVNTKFENSKVLQ